MHDPKKESDIERIRENSKAICFHILIYSFTKKKSFIYSFTHSFIHSFIHSFVYLLQATRGARNPNLQVVITHALHLRSQHSFGLPIRKNEMYRTHFDHTRLDFLSFVI